MTTIEKLKQIGVESGSVVRSECHCGVIDPFHFVKMFASLFPYRTGYRININLGALQTADPHLSDGISEYLILDIPLRQMILLSHLIALSN